ncbi:MAG: GvpL/GvpF family gas vesicle protein [Peptococcaceae bacterium]|jgi:hypothetical protein|nr:GvpL/GvpF family gas vesicle protein [Peptococcaceae bacterium]
MKFTKGLYAYCIIDREFSPDPNYPLPDQTFSINYQNIAAVVSRLSESGWQPTKQNIMNHQKVITKIQEGFTVLPLRFGMVFKDREEIDALIEEKYSEIQLLLLKIRGRVELGLRLFWHHEAFVDDIGKRTIEDLKKEYLRASQDRYSAAIEVGKFVEEVVNRRREEYIKRIYEPLQAAADDALLNPITGEKMVFNAAFLVAENLTGHFDRTVEDFQTQYKDKLIFRYSGPWPPYNFVAVNW